MKLATRRLAAFAAMLAVAWVALWPLVSAAHALAFSEPVPLCHQAGLQVGTDEAPEDGMPIPPHSPKQHCPLCILAFFGMASPVPTVALAHATPQDLGRDFRSAARPADLSSRLPESRAPPAFVVA